MEILNQILNFVSFKCYCLFVALLFFYFGNSQNNVQDFTIKWINGENGLKQQNVMFANQDEDGFIWLGTNSGLYKYDGINCIKIHNTTNNENIEKFVIHLAKQISTNKFQFELFPDNHQYSLANSKIEFISSERPIYNINNFCLYPKSNIIKNASIKKFYKKYLDDYYTLKYYSACLVNQKLYIPNNNNIVIFDSKGKSNKIFISKKVPPLLLQFKNNVFLLNENGFEQISNVKNTRRFISVEKKIFQVLVNSGTSGPPNTVLFGDNNLRYYMKYNNSIYEILYKNNRIYSEYLFKCPSNDITCITYLKKDNIYLVGTQTKGLAILFPKKINTVYLEDDSNPSLNYTYTVLPVENSKIWYSSSGWYFDLESKNTIKSSSLNNQSNIRFLMPYKNEIYYHYKHEFLNIKNNQNDHNIQINEKIKKILNPLIGYTIHQNNTWLSNEKQLFYIQNNKLIQDAFFNFKIPKINYIKSIDNNTIVIATIKGLFEYNTKFHSLVEKNILKNCNVRFIQPEKNKSYWVGCYGEGLFFVTNKSTFKVNDQYHKLSSVHALVEDKKNNIWISTNDGLFTCKKSSVINNIINNKHVVLYKYELQDGLLSNEFNGCSTHPVLQNDSIIGFPSMAGFVWFNPTEVIKHHFNGNIIIDKVLANNKQIINPYDGTYFISNDVDIFSIEFKYGYYFNRENLSVSYRFNDQENWTEIKGNSFQLGRYKQGNHKLFIKINTHGNSQAEAVIKSFNFNFQSKYYETYWFWAINVLTLFFLLIVTHKIGIYFAKKREDILKQKIKEKTKELEASIIDLELSKNDLNKSLHEKNILLKEIHHRVKNNLQLVMSLLNIQATDKVNSSIEEFIEKGQSRISSMVLIHENLYKWEDVGNINFEEYTSSLVDNIKTSFGERSKNISVFIYMDDIYFDIQTSIPIGLIINEIVTNAFKHAFNNVNEGKISISIKLIDNNSYLLNISDNGSGYYFEDKRNKSIGLELVSLLVLQLKGEFSIINEKGTNIQIKFYTI